MNVADEEWYYRLVGVDCDDDAPVLRPLVKLVRMLFYG